MVAAKVMSALQLSSSSEFSSRPCPSRCYEVACPPSALPTFRFVLVFIGFLSESQSAHRRQYATLSYEKLMSLSADPRRNQLSHSF